MTATARRWPDVLAGKARWSCDCADVIEWLRELEDHSVSLVLFSPPYEGQRTYGIDFKRIGQVWVDWMREIIRECCRVSTGLVVVNASCPVRNHSYSPALEWLVTDLTRIDGLACGPSPFAWVKSDYHDEADGNATPGSGGARYQRRDWEPLYAFCDPGKLPLTWTDNTAFGKPPKYGPGGEYSTRDVNGIRANDPWGKGGRGNGVSGRRKNGEKMKGNAPGPPRRSNGEMKSVKRMMATCGSRNGDNKSEANYTQPAISNPGNVIRAPVGGGKCGSPIAHEGEAPMSLHVAERIVCWYAEPGSVVCDPFSGTGTTAHACIVHGRRFIGTDVRESQVKLCERRMRSVTPSMIPA